MRSISLNTKEVARLKSAIRRGEYNCQFHDFLDTLDTLLNEQTGRIDISENTFHSLQRFASVVARPNWQAILYSIFGRTLRTAFGNIERCTELIEIGGGVPPAVIAENNRNVRVL